MRARRLLAASFGALRTRRPPGRLSGEQGRLEVGFKRLLPRSGATVPCWRRQPRRSALLQGNAHGGAAGVVVKPSGKSWRWLFGFTGEGRVGECAAGARGSALCTNPNALQLLSTQSKIPRRDLMWLHFHSSNVALETKRPSLPRTPFCARHSYDSASSWLISSF